VSDAKLFTLGIEEEFQLVDPVTRDLRSHIHELLEAGKGTSLADQLKPELHQSVVEVGTNVCADIHEAKAEVIRLRREVSTVAKLAGARIAAAGTHPFARWQDQHITDAPRYDQLVEDLQQVARANLIFGLHVHVGIPSREIGIQIMNAARYFLPHIYALSTNSPFWEGRDTGLKSYRGKIFDRFPRTGVPDYFNSYADYQSYVDLLVKTNCIDNGKKIWWDLRLHPFFQTLEWRVCDVPMRIEETIALASLMQAITYKLYKLIRSNLGWRLYRRILINENKWRAARYGIHGKMIDFGKQTEVPFVDLMGELLEFVGDELKELGSEAEASYVHQILAGGTGADRQVAAFKASGGDTKAVVDLIVEETHRGLG
jgi:carboxylate-amine ligase